MSLVKQKSAPSTACHEQIHMKRADEKPGVGHYLSKQSKYTNQSLNLCDVHFCKHE